MARVAANPMWVDLQRALIEKIVEGRYGEGTHLPTEAQLGEEFGVSRSVVREAIKVLVEKGLVRIDRGNGTLVSGKAQWRSLDPVVLAARLRGPDSEAVLRELFVLRKSVEPELAYLAAQNSDTDAFLELGRRVNDLKDALGDEDRYLAADLAFHQTIAAASGVHLAQELFSTISEPLSVSRVLTGQIEGAIENAHDYHLELFEHIRQRDGEAARVAMRDHLQWAEDHLGDSTR